MSRLTPDLDPDPMEDEDSEIAHDDPTGEPEEAVELDDDDDDEEDE